MALGQNSKHQAWLRRKARVRKKAKGTDQRPRLTVFRSDKHIYGQIINDLTGQTIAAASSREKDFAAQTAGAEGARTCNRGGAGVVGKLLGERAKAKGVEKVVFDRNGYLFHGRVKALADGVRETGVKF